MVKEEWVSNGMCNFSLGVKSKAQLAQVFGVGISLYHRNGASRLLFHKCGVDTFRILAVWPTSC
jgi:hypothetical protein